jgi:predicted transcriptional regulator
MEPLKQRSDNQSESLFPLAPKFRIVELGAEQAKAKTDDLNVLKELIDSSEEMYPGIRRWFSGKVVPGLETTQRLAWVAYEGEKAVAAAVLKRGKQAKFCHLRIDPGFQDMDLGQLFFTMMALETRHLAQEIHFTLPESLWCSKSSFFESFGFARAVKALRQYRRGDTELACSAPQAVAQKAALDKLPTLVKRFSVGGYRLGADILVSMKPKYAERILAGSKLIEIRKKFSNKWVGRKAALYASSPQKALVGEATVRSVTSGTPTAIWARFGAGIGCSATEFHSYVGSATQIFAIELDDVFPYKAPIGLSVISHLLSEDLRPPQSYCDLSLGDEESPWAKAVSVAGALHGPFVYGKGARSNSLT